MPESPDVPNEAHSYGAVIQIYRVKFIRRLAAFGILAGLSVPMMAWGTWAVLAGHLIGLLILAVGIFLIALPTWTTVHDARARGRVGYLFSEGFCYVDADGKALAARWDEIDGLWVCPTAQNITVTVRKLDGSELVFGDPWLNDYKGFVAAIEEYTALSKLPVIRRSLDKGAQVCFGPLKMTRTGLIKESHIFPISELDEVALELQPGTSDSSGEAGPTRRKLRVVHKGRSYTWPDVTVGDVSNYHAMMTVLEEHGKAHQPYY